MNNVQTSNTERRPIEIDEAEDAILARWEDPLKAGIRRRERRL